MAGIQFTRATKKQARLRLAFVGPAGSGKTYSALSVATALGGKVAVMDTEHGSASKYAGLFDFDAVEPETYSPRVYIDTIRAAAEAGYEVLIIDSLSHAWMGKGGALEMVDAAAKRNQGNSYVGWRDVTPLHNEMVDAMLAAPLHIIATMRSKTEYVLEENERGKKVPRKVGLAPVQRDGLEFEFDVVGDLDQDNNFLISKTRCTQLRGAVIHQPGPDLAATLKLWLSDGVALAGADQIAELRSLARAISPKAAASMEAKVARGVTAEQADEWLATMRAGGES